MRKVMDDMDKINLIILFRGKRMSSGEWIYGSYAVTHSEKRMGRDEIHHIIQYSGGYHQVDKGTVCQCIGKTDRNGNKIFEGDILSAYLDDEHPEDITYVQVVWNGFSWCIRETCYDEPMIDSDCEKFEVCGNIFDNPELMEGGES